MADFNPVGTEVAARKVAGISDSRQIRDVQYGTNITYSKFRFLAMFGDTVPGEDKKAKAVTPNIKSRSSETLTPELYDSEVSPTTFSATANGNQVADVGGSFTITVDNVQGLEVGIDINNPIQYAAGKITAINGLTVTISVLYSAQGAITWLAGVNGLKNLEILNMASGDAPTINDGVYSEPINRINNIQFSWKAMSQGMLQSMLALYGNRNGESPNADWKDQMQKSLVDFNRRRENAMILAPTAYAENGGSAATRVLHAKGMLGWAGSVVPNQNADGSFSFSDFTNYNLAAAREFGSPFEIWGLAGSRVVNGLNAIMDGKVRITNQTDKYRVNYSRFETAQGNFNLVPVDCMDTDAREGQMITFNPDYLTRRFLKGLDFKAIDDLELNNILGIKSALAVAECLMSANPNHIRLHTNLLKAA